MHEGKLLKEGSMQEIQRDPLVAEVYLGKGGRRMLKRRALNRATGRVPSSAAYPWLSTRRRSYVW